MTGGHQPGPITPAQRRPPLVLSVEDDAATQELYEMVLQQGGFRVAAAASGQECLDKVELLHPVLILTDIAMPGAIDGCAMTRLLKANPRTWHIPVVALTGYDAATIWSAADFQQVLTKPIMPDALVEALRSVLAGNIRQQSPNEYAERGRGPRPGGRNRVV